MACQSNDEFGYPSFDEHGVMPLTNTTDLYPHMLQNITVLRKKQGEDFALLHPKEEMAILLIEGSVSYQWGNRDVTAARRGPLGDPAYCLHVCRGTPVRLRAESDSEILVQRTANERTFDPVLYTTKNTRCETFGQGQFEGKAQRTVRTFFDIENAPYSNMVCGEILIPQGGWSSYPPHMHPHPEVYYYRFGHPNGFGACFLDDAAYMIRDRSFAAVPGGKYHPQVNAPGYPMMYVWMIRHFEGYPWTERNFAPAHQWLLERVDTNAQRPSAGGFSAVVR
ncbi:MAG: 5-deoxy-glucuronate isomerase [Oscillospiraceae bacterium]|jgi:5-deoxy-glucuronate isomerase|nr:5-deoxy-glucuronate isomerase [Oscillospiraceae bacterium]